MHPFQKQSFGKHLQNNPTSSPLLQLQIFPQNEFLEITTKFTGSKLITT
jgi:hypothetical protein